MTEYPRDLISYGRNPPDPRWPNGARIAVQFVINYEEGGENNILHGDAASEAFLSEIVGAQALHGVRHMNMESIYEYGSRAGFWRLHRMFTERDIPVTVYAVATALDRNHEAATAMPGDPAPTRWPRSPSKAASSTAPIPTPTTCPTGRGSAAGRSLSCPTRWIPTTCGSRRPRGSTRAISSSPI